MRKGLVMGATFYLTTVGPMNRYRVHLEDDEGTVILRSQLRELKPMSIDELALVHSTALKDVSYEHVHDGDGYHYVLRARDAHELGRGASHETEREMLDEIEAVKACVPRAGFVDETPHEERIRTIDYIRQESNKVLAEQGLEVN